MRVAHIITRMIIGGAQENTLFNCSDLVRQHNDDVLLITGPALGPEGGLIKPGQHLDFAVHLIDCLRRPIVPTRDWQAFREIKRVLREFRPDVVHTHSAKGGILGREAAWAIGVPAIVHTIHGAPFYPYQNILIRNFYRLCEKRESRRCHRIISVADAMTDLMVDSGVAPREMFTTVYSGMEVTPLLNAASNRSRIRAKYGFNDDDVVVIKIARLFHLKGHVDLIRAARSVVQDCPNVRFLLVGDGILRDDLKKLVCQLELDDYFRFAGLIDPTDIPDHVGAADLLVHASYREGLARALPQALIAGRPAISYDIDGAREVVIDQVTGRLIKPGDIEGLALAIEQLVNDARLRDRLGGEGRQRFAERFCHRNMTRLIRDEYLKILNR